MVNEYEEVAKHFIKKSKDLEEFAKTILVSLYKKDSFLFNADKELKTSSEKMSAIYKENYKEHYNV